MRVASWRYLAGVLLVCGSTAQQTPMQPFVIDHFARTDSAIDVSFLLDPPAGKDGFIHVKEGRLVTGAGKRFRIWGVNVTGWTAGSAIMPPKEEAGLWAAALARHGVNCVRFHFLDRTTQQRPQGLIDGARNDTRHFDPVQLDRLDYFIYELKKRGIYSNLNLNVGRTYKEGDGVPDFDLIGVAKAFTYIGERLLELQREYAAQLLTHYNPYTKSEYRNEPAVAIVEIVNENSLIEFWARNWLRGELVANRQRFQLDLTPTYERILTRRYNRWLEQALAPEKLARVRQQAGAKPNEPVKRLRREEFRLAGFDRFHAEAEFYAAMEHEFFAQMKTYLKDRLGVQSLIVGTADHTYWIPSQPLLRSTAQMDIVDGHVYWQHPAIWGRRNTPMVNEPLASTVVKLSRSPMSGRPFTVSEVNHPHPNEYGAEMIPILAAYAAFQDWDGVTFYTFEPRIRSQWRAMIPDPFDITLDPVKMPQMAAGALIFLRPDVSVARKTIERTYSREQVNETLRLPEAERPFFTPGFPRALPLVHGSRIRCIDCAPTASIALTPSNPLVSDTGELSWLVSKENGGLVSIDTDRTQALIGFVRANNGQTRHLAADVKNDFCALTLSSLDGRPVARSQRLLFIAAGRTWNSKAEWNERRTLWTQLGEPPTLIEPVTGWILLKELEGAVGLRVFALDGAARQLGEQMRGRRLEDGWEFAVGAPATTLYLIEVVR